MNRERTSSSMLILAVTLMVLCLPLAAQTTGVVPSGPLPSPLPLFPSDNWWNADVSQGPLDPGSNAFINFIGPTRGLHPDLGGDAGGNSIYGIPYIVVPGTLPLEQVVFEYDDESDYQAPGRPPGYPIPIEARTEPKWIEGGEPGGGEDGDRHMLIVDRDNRILYEIYAAYWNAAMNRWEGGSGAIFPLDSNARRPEGWTSADAAGLAILPGLIRYDEAYGTAPIEHAFRVTVRSTNGYVYPASHRAGSTSGALPMGARLRLRASKDISGFSEPVRRIFQAMKTYGLIVADNGSDMYITGTYDTRWDNDVLNPAFSAIKASDFEVVQLGWEPGSQPTCTSPTISLQPQPVTVAPGQAATLSVTAAGTAPLSFQWYRGASGNTSSPIAGATVSTLVYTPTSTTSVWVRVSNACGNQNSTAATITVQQPPAGCTPASSHFCTQSGRFEVSLSARDPRTNKTDSGYVMSSTDVFGYFAFPVLAANQTDPQVFVKVLDGRAINGKFWVFFASLTDVEFTLTVRDTQTGEVKTYRQEPYSQVARNDTSAF